MTQCIMIGCDLHEDSMLLKIAQDCQTPETRTWKNTVRERARMTADLKRRSKAAGGARVIFAYEASGAGFGLYDQLTAAGIECCVLAPTKIPKSSRQKREKTDEKDALQLLELVRAHVLAGNPLPKVWIPDPQTRDDREVVRMRLDVAVKITAVKTQVKSLLKRNCVTRPGGLGKGWTRAFRAWLKVLSSDWADQAETALKYGSRSALTSLLRQLDFLEQEQEHLDKAVAALVYEPRYLAAVQELHKLLGVGALTAMVFLSEIGDLTRFNNRRQIAAYLGLCPTSFESGRTNDRKGHITRQGSARVRRVLCQAAWSHVRHDPREKAAYERIKAKNPKKAKIAVVASMRRLAIRMWHRGRQARELPCVNWQPSSLCKEATVGFSKASSRCPKGVQRKTKSPGETERLGKRMAASRGR